MKIAGGSLLPTGIFYGFLWGDSRARENAILIPEYEIAGRAEKELPDKEALILVY